MTTHENEVILQTTIDIVCDELEAELADMVGDPEYAGWLGIIAVAAVALGADTTYVARWIGLDANVLQDLSDRTWADSVARKGAFALVATVTHWLQTFSEEEGL